MRKITTSLDRLNVLLRCFVVQASWNFKSMLGLGFCFCVIPLARRLYNTKQERSDFLRRHLDFFNAHPYFVGFCLGAVIKLEEEALYKKWPDKRPISIFKERMTGPLGGLGDQLFWDRIKPATAAFGVLIALQYGWIALPLYLFIYNVPHIYMRIKSFNVSYRMGFDIVSVLSKRSFKQASHYISLAGMLTAGILLAVAADWSFKQNAAVGTAFIVSVVLARVLIYFKKSINFIIFTIVLISAIIGCIFAL